MFYYCIIIYYWLVIVSRERHIFDTLKKGTCVLSFSSLLVFLILVYLRWLETTFNEKSHLFDGNQNPSDNDVARVGKVHWCTNHRVRWESGWGTKAGHPHNWRDSTIVTSWFQDLLLVTLEGVQVKMSSPTRVTNLTYDLLLREVVLGLRVNNLNKRVSALIFLYFKRCP